MMFRGGPAEIIVLTGPSRAGKTTICRCVVETLRSRGLSVAGVLTEDGPGEGGASLQIVRDLRSNDRHVLARRHGEAAEAGATAATDCPNQTEPPPLLWEFDERGLAFGRRALRVAARAGCDLLVVDQIGPLEVRYRQGWTGVYEVVNAGHYNLALLVVNRKFVERFVADVGLPCRVLEVDDSCRDQLPAAIVTARWP
jgi:nucleoside-triphosphatase THEP1